MTTHYHPSRRYPRHPVLIECLVEGASGRSAMRLSELGMGGCYVDTRMLFAVGAPVTLHSTLGGAEVTMSGRIVYTQPGFGFGVAFDTLPDMAQQQLAAALSQAAAH